MYSLLWSWRVSVGTADDRQGAFDVWPVCGHARCSRRLMRSIQVRCRPVPWLHRWLHAGADGFTESRILSSSHAFELG